MINLDNITNENNKKHNEKWPYIPDHPYRIFIIGGSGSGKTNTLLNLIKEQDSRDVIDKIYLYAKDLSEPKYEYLIKKREDAGIKNVNNPNAFIVCSNTMDDAYEDIDNYNPKRNKKAFTVFDDMTAYIMTNKKFQAIIKELFIRCIKLNISLVSFTQSYFSIPKDVRFNSTHYLIEIDFFCYILPIKPLLCQVRNLFWTEMFHFFMKLYKSYLMIIFLAKLVCSLLFF